MASATSASALSTTARSVCGASFSNSARPSGLPTYRPTSSRSDSNSNKSALKFCKGSLNNAQRALCKTIPAKVPFLNPFHAADIGRGGRFSAQAAAQIIDQNVMIFGPAFGIRHNPLENFKHRVGLDIQSRLFFHLAADCFFQLLTCFDNAAGKGPVALERLLAALHQQDLFVFKNKRTHPQERARRVLSALHVCMSSCVNTRSLSRPAAPGKPTSAP